jgi:CheY-like chemotaxis protein
VSNILTNSAKYTDAGGEIRIELSEEQGSALICITDNGVGIPPELLPQIFDLFVQSARSLDRSQGGLGIGLSVVQRLIEMQGGHVSAQSEGPGRGARFNVRLPLISPPHASNEESAAMPVPPRRVLIVDDNVDAANSLAMILSVSGHTVEAVYNSRDALERAASAKPEVILLDIGLPGMDGYEVAKRLRAAGSNARIVALTGYGQSEDVERGRAAGFDAHLVKPVDIQCLLRNLSEPSEVTTHVRSARG